MKQIILCCFLMAFSACSIYAQVGAVPKTDSLPLKTDTSHSGKLPAFFNLLYSSPAYRINSFHYQYPPAGNGPGTVINVIGTIFLSVLADKTNHNYMPAPPRIKNY